MFRVENEIEAIADSVEEILAAQAQRSPDVPALLADDRSVLTYRGLYDEVKSIQAALRASVPTGALAAVLARVLAFSIAP